MTSKGSPRFSYRLTKEREKKLFEFQKLLKEMGENKATNTRAKTIDKALDIGIARIKQILEDREKLGL